MNAGLLRRPLLLAWRLPSLGRSAINEPTGDDLPATTDPREALPRVSAVLSAVAIPVVAMSASAQVGAGFAYRDVVALLIAYAIATVCLVRVPWARLPAAWSGSLIGLQLLFVVSLTTLTGGGDSPYFALYAAVLVIAGWHLGSGPFLGVVASVAVIEAWRAVAVDGGGSFDQVTISLPFFGLLGLLSLVTARRLTAALLLLRQDQGRTSDTLIAVQHLAGDLGSDPLPELARAAERVFESRAMAISMEPTSEGMRGAVVTRAGGSHLTIAISGAVSTYGLLQLEREVPYSSTERRLAAILADTVGRALDAHRLFDEVRQASERDVLTGLLNRRSLEADLEHVVGPALSGGQTVTVAFVDIDGLKVINDDHGHDVGDRVIRLVGRALAAAVRYEDRVYRAGGDEFVVLAVGLSASEATLLGQRLRTVAKEPARRTDDPLEVPIMLSVGIAIGAGPDIAPDQLLAEADQEMYRLRVIDRVGTNRPARRAPRSSPDTD